MIRVACAVKSFCLQIFRDLWILKYWIVLTLVLCGGDQAIRYFIFNSASEYLLKLWLFYSLSVLSVVFVIGRIGRYVMSFVFIFWTSIELLQFCVAWRFNMLLSGNWILILGASSFVGLREFFKDIVSLGNLSFEYRMLFPETVEREVSAKDRKLVIDQLFEGMLELTGVKGFKDRESEMNFLSPTFRPYETRKIVGNEIKYE